VSSPTISAPTRVERILAFMLIGIFLVSVVALFAVLIATWAGHTDFGGSVWPVVAMTPYFGLPVSFLLLFALLIIATVRRARSAKRDDGV
jgi:heme/copper-type cytochrome/quinol oxidase subunit 3